MLPAPPIKAPWKLDNNGNLVSDIWINWLQQLATVLSASGSTTTGTTVVNQITEVINLSSSQLAAVNSRIDDLEVFANISDADYTDTLASSFESRITDLEIGESYESAAPQISTFDPVYDSNLLTWLSF